ncbi:hypothetical protein VTP01DRAFT_8943 [Rhizomucor pusillus]|uniref:uncharacterized protein n=1 Tax=Rhizomucor pusillus TaxID=4840 RepID=UPI00374464C3
MGGRVHSVTANLLVLASVFFSSTTFALRFGEQCDPFPYYSESWQYLDSCENVYLFCDPTTNTCNYKGCSNSDYLKGWDTRIHPFPQRCNSSSYCPDNNSGCKPLVPTGGHCELQRDDECAGQNPICLNSTCYIKAAPLGGRCSADITDYISYDAEGYAVQQRIIRDNCTLGTYCDERNGLVCIPSKANGAPCQQDRECISQYCSNSGSCINGPDVFHTIPAWLWAVLGVAVFLFVLLILAMLWVLHRYQSKKEREKIRKFFGDNEEFAKYAMLEHDDVNAAAFFDDPNTSQRLPPPPASPRRHDSRTSMVYLQTPDYQESAALGTSRPISWRNSSTSKLRTSFAAPPSSRNSGSFTPPLTGMRSSTVDLPRGSTPDLSRPSTAELPHRSPTPDNR